LGDFHNYKLERISYLQVVGSFSVWGNFITASCKYGLHGLSL
jgi:hypothetical protein